MKKIILALSSIVVIVGLVMVALVTEEETTSPAIAPQSHVVPSTQISGSVLFLDGTPAVWHTRLGQRASAQVCLVCPSCGTIRKSKDTGDVCEWYRDLSWCDHAQDSGTYQISDIPRHAFRRGTSDKPCRLEVRQDLGQTLYDVGAEITTHDFVLDQTPADLAVCEQAAEECDGQDNNCNGVADEGGVCTGAPSEGVLNTTSCLFPEIQALYRPPTQFNIVVPIFLHVVLNDDGLVTSREGLDWIKEAWETQLAYSNLKLLEAGVTLKVVGSEFLYNSRFAQYNGEEEVAAEIRSTNNHHGRVVDVYVVEKTGSKYAAISSFPGTVNPGIITSWQIAGASISPAESIFVHELGHYLGLLHPFALNYLGQACWQSDDFMCDTPRDPGPKRCPMIRFPRAQVCEGAACDPETGICLTFGTWCHGVPLMTNNIMGYYQPCSADQLVFTHDQRARMLCSLDREHPHLHLCVHGEDQDGDGVSCQDDCDDNDAEVGVSCQTWPTGSCSHDSDCDDGNPCTKDTCSAGTCHVTEWGADQKYCAPPDPDMRCSHGKCIQWKHCWKDQQPCNDGNPCTRDETCYRIPPGEFRCYPGRPVKDGTPCGKEGVCSNGECLDPGW